MNAAFQVAVRPHPVREDDCKVQAVREADRDEAAFTLIPSTVLDDDSGGHRKPASRTRIRGSHRLAALLAGSHEYRTAPYYKRIYNLSSRPNVVPLSRQRRFLRYRSRPSRARRSSAAAAC